MSVLEDTLIEQLGNSVNAPVRELQFHPIRRWRFDLAWPDIKVACEVEGATWAQGRHTRGAGFDADCDKYNTAALFGWLVIRVTGNMIADGRAVDYVTQALAVRGGTT